MKDIMDNSKILLINVSKGKIGEDNSGLLGAMLINRIQLAAMDRASIPKRIVVIFTCTLMSFKTLPPNLLPIFYPRLVSIAST